MRRVVSLALFLEIRNVILMIFNKYTFRENSPLKHGFQFSSWKLMKILDSRLLNQEAMKTYVINNFEPALIPRVSFLFVRFYNFFLLTNKAQAAIFDSQTSSGKLFSKTFLKQIFFIPMIKTKRKVICRANVAKQIEFHSSPLHSEVKFLKQFILKWLARFSSGFIRKKENLCSTKQRKFINFFLVASNNN